MFRSVLLVHGAFHTGDCWENLAPELLQRGLNPKPITLSGHRGNSKLPSLVGMGTYGSDIIAAAEAIGEPCILLGHSLGGMAISEAAERRPDLFDRLIYLSAFVPKLGKCSLRDLPPTTATMRSSVKPSLNGTATMPPEIANVVFYNRCTPAIQQKATQLLCPQPVRAATDSVTATQEGLGSVSKYYIECTDDNALPIASQREMQANMPLDSVQSIDSDHSPFLSQPAVLAALIQHIAES